MSDNNHRSQYDSPLKNQVVGYIRGGKKIREAASLFKVPLSTAGLWWSNYRKRGTTHNLPRSGRPHKLSPRGKRLLVLEARKHRQLTLQMLGRSVTPQVSGNTARRILGEAGYHRRVARHKFYLKKEHIYLRLKWARKYQAWRLNHWEHIIWSDECYIFIGDTRGTVYVTRRPDEVLDDDCTIKTFAQSPIRVMIWACFAYGYKGPLVVLDYPGGPGGGMNSERYVEQVLSEKLKHFYNSVKQHRRYSAFQQDGARCHTSKMTMQWLSKNKIKLFPHPASSPDLNPIENLWHTLKQHVRSRAHTPTSSLELQQAVKEAWDSITIDEINHLRKAVNRG